MKILKRRSLYILLVAKIEGYTIANDKSAKYLVKHGYLEEKLLTPFGMLTTTELPSFFQSGDASIPAYPVLVLTEKGEDYLVQIAKRRR